MIAGPAVFICNECVELCVAVLIEQKVPIVDGSACDAMSRILKYEEDLSTMRHAHRMAGIGLVGVMHTIAGVLSGLGLKQEDAMQCCWCGRTFAAGDEIRNHVATCEKHPAVIRLMEIQGKETA